MKWIRDPKHKDKVITILVLLALGILSLLVVVSTIKLSSMETRLNRLVSSIPQYALPKDGYTPIKNVDYVDGIDGVDGKDGTNAVSTHTETTIVKEIPIPGQDGRDGRDGRDGKDAKNMSIAIDPETCVLSLKWDGDDFPLDLVKIPNCEVL